MSRIGNNPISIPSGVEIKFESDVVSVKGPKGELNQKIDSSIGVDIDGDTLKVTRSTEQKQHKANHGLYRALISNMITGVTEGYKTQQELVGVGYKAEVKGQILEMNLGFSHNIYVQIPEEIK